jgi:hypothetical protein
LHFTFFLRPNDALTAPHRPSATAATFTGGRRSRKTEQLKKNAGKVDAVPAVFSFLHRD